MKNEMWFTSGVYVEQYYIVRYSALLYSYGPDRNPAFLRMKQMLLGYSEGPYYNAGFKDYCTM
jgi:hypothetical protein